MSLNPKQIEFCRAYLSNHGNAYQAALDAGYSEAYAKNAKKKLVENGGISEYIHQRIDKIEQKADSDVDEVLSNIYRIGAGKPIKRVFKRETQTLDDEGEIISKDDIEKEVTESPAPYREQVSAAELWLKYKGLLRNDNKEMEAAKIRKLTADAEISEAKSKLLNGANEAERLVKIDKFLDGLEDVLIEDETTSSGRDNNPEATASPETGTD